MNKLLFKRCFRFVLFIALFFTGQISRAQQLFYETFDDGSLTNTPTTTTNPLWSGNTGSFSLNTTNAIYSSTNDLVSNTANTLATIKNQYLSASGKTLSTTDLVYRFLYKNNSSTTPDAVDVPAANNNSWRLWLATDGTYGYCLVAKGGNIILRRINSGGSNDLYTIAVSNNQVYSFKLVRTGSNGLWTVYMNTGTAEPTSVVGSGQYYNDATTVLSSSTIYMQLESNNKVANTNMFLWDNIQVSSPYLNVTYNSNTLTTSSTVIYPSTTNAIFGFQLTATEDLLVDHIAISQTLSTSSPVPSANIKIIRSTDNSYATTGDNTDISSSFSINQQTSPTNYLDFYAGSGYTIANGSSYYYFVVVTTAASYTSPASAVTFSMSPSGSYNGYTGSFHNYYTNSFSTNSYTGSNPSIVFGNYFDWTGGNSTDFNAANNYYGGTAPGANDIVRIGVSSTNSATYYRQPSLTATKAVGGITIGTSAINGGNTAPILTTAYALTVNGDITQNSLWTSSTPTPQSNIVVSSGGSISAVNLNVGDGVAPTSATGVAGLQLSLSGAMTFSGNINITSSNYSGSSFGPGTIQVSGASALTCAGVVTNNSSAGGTYHSTFAMNPGTSLFLTGTTPFTASANGSNYFIFGGSQTFSGASQTIAANLTNSAGTTTHFGNVTFSGSGTKTLTTGTFYVDGNFTNSSGILCDFTTNSPTVGFAGSSAQAVTNSSATAITFYNVNFEGASTKTLGGAGLFNVSSTGTLSFTNGTASTILAAGSSLLTLKSDATGTATVAALPAAGSITGTVTAERYVSPTRGYRLFSSPVSTTTVYTLKAYTLSGILAGTIVSGPGTGGSLGISSPNNNGFDVSSTTTIPNNPSAFMYKESDADRNSRTISGSDYKGFASTSQAVPMGAGMMIFVRGSRSLTQAGNNSNNVYTSPYPTALATTLKFSGTITGGSVSAVTPTFTGSPSYYNSGTASNSPSAGTTVSGFSSTLSYTSHSSANDGFNLLGNPFPSTIDLEKLTYGSGISSTIYTLNSTLQSFGTYVCTGTATDGVALNGASRYVVSGEGFFVQAKSTGTPTVTFPESAKTAYPSGNLTSTGTPSAIPTTFSLANKTPAIRIRLVQDSVLYNESLIAFSSQNVNTFEEGIDASYFSAPSQPVYMYSYTDDGAAVVYNKMNSLENIKSIKLYAEGSVTGAYQMQFSGVNSIDTHYLVFLKDAVTKDSVNIVTNPIYSYQINRTDTTTFGANRFTLVVHKDTDGKYQLLTFSGAKAQTAIKLSWTTKNESDVETWDVQRSIDGGKTYVTLGTVQSKNLGAYSFTDNSPVLGSDIYRLKQSDVNDAITYSDLVSFTFDNVANEVVNTVSLYPNPAVSNISIDFTQKIDHAIQINIVNSSGRTVKQTSLNACQHVNQDVSALQTGLYIVDVYDTVTNQKLSSSKFIKN